MGVLGTAHSQPMAASEGCSPAKLREEMAEIARVTHGPVGAAVLIVEGGPVVTLNGERHLPMQSVYKLPIAMAVLQRMDVGRLLLDCGAGVSSRDTHGMTPLMWAAVGGEVPTLSLLVERGADVNAACEDGRTALMCAGAHARIEGGAAALSKTRIALHPEGAASELRKAGAVE